MPSHSLEPAPGENRFKEFEDPHYHDDEEVALPAETDRPPRANAVKKPARKLLERRRYEDD